MDPSTMIQHLSRGDAIKFPQNARSLDYAQQLDRQAGLQSFRDQFRIPTKSALRKKAVRGTSSRNCDHSLTSVKSANGTNGFHHERSDNESPCIYFCGNSLGCQPKLISEYLSTHLQTWADHGVNGHFTELEESPLTAWQDMAESCAKKSAPIVGADAVEVVIMNTLTANLHLLMASFYRPSEKRHKIICEWKPFPSDYVSNHTQCSVL
jgi:kynureninase